MAIAFLCNDIKYSSAIEFCEHLSKLSGLQVDLPTEAQWEYACRAGTQTRFYSGDDERDLERIAWFRNNANGTTHDVGTKDPNTFRLYDMLGNVWEPCADTLPRYGLISSSDPVGVRSHLSGMMRGGGWAGSAEECRAAARVLSNERFGCMGIRIAINPDTEEKASIGNGQN